MLAGIYLISAVKIIVMKMKRNSDILQSGMGALDGGDGSSKDGG